MDADGTTTITIGPERPSGCPEGNWIQTLPGKGWFPILRLYSPTERVFHTPWVDNRRGSGGEKLARGLRRIVAAKRDRARVASERGSGGMDLAAAENFGLR